MSHKHVRFAREQLTDGPEATDPALRPAMRWVEMTKDSTGSTTITVWLVEQRLRVWLDGPVARVGRAGTGAPSRRGQDEARSQSPDAERGAQALRQQLAVHRERRDRWRATLDASYSIEAMLVAGGPRMCVLRLLDRGTTAVSKFGRPA